ncbi:MAG TPA: C25 family cysteine peptidase [Candidatus Limnocylindria bacterium]|nr:C25 family cysteine peptidase [Candidatus Limnocylindria bacterium]
MSQSRRLPAFLASFLTFALTLAPDAGANPVQVVVTDDRSVVLRLTIPEYDVQPSAAEGRVEVRAPGLRLLDRPGRPRLPFASALLAVPPGATVTARIVGAGQEETREGVRVAIGDRPAFVNDSTGLGWIPTTEPVEAIQDGVWPPSEVVVGTPFVLRGQRMVAVSLQPFRYDEGAGRLTVRRDLTVRVEFAGGASRATLAAATEDRHWEPVFEGALLNYRQGRAWRMPREGAARPLFGGSLFERGERTQGGGGAETVEREVRVHVDTTGLYVLTFDQLRAADPLFPLLPIDRVSVHRHEFQEGTTPPYVTVELPIEVDDVNGNTTFDSGDRIVVFVQNWAERSRASWAQRAWGDAEVIYATYVDVGNLGRRMPGRPGWRNVPSLAPLASYPWTQRYERNFFYKPIPRDTLADQFQWTEVGQYYVRPDSFRFETNHLDTTRTARVDVTWQGDLENPHFNWAWVRNGLGRATMVADSVVWFGRGAQTAGRDLPGGAFTEGLTNGIAEWGKTNSGPPDPTTNFVVNTRFNHFDVTYWRRYQALAGYLRANSGDAAGEFQIRATGFPASDIRVYDVSDSANPVRLTLDASHILPGPGGTFEVEYQDSTATGTVRRYFVALNPHPLPAAKLSAVNLRPQLTNRVTGDYLVIVPRAFESSVAPLVNLRAGQGLSVVTSPAEAVYDEFNGGRKSSHAIKRFVRYALDNWSCRFVMLVGDGSEDPQNLLNETVPDWIPIHKIAAPVGIPLGFEVVPSDPWYGCFEGPETTCDALFNSSGLPVIPEVFVGRLPVGSLQQASNVIAKVVAYENFAPDQSWRKSLLLSGDDEFSTITTFGGPGGGPDYCRRSYENRFRLLNETIANVVNNEAGLRGTAIDLFPLTFLLSGEPITCCVPDTCRPDQSATQGRTQANVTPQMIARLNEGRMWWNYQGHANESVLAHEDLYVNRSNADNTNQLTNDGKPFLFSAFSCHVNAFARVGEGRPNIGPTIGQDVINLPSRGAIAVWASSGYEIIPRNGTDHINVTWARSMFSDPPRDPYLGDQGARVVLGETIALALLRYLDPPFGGPQPQPEFSERGIGLTYQLLGDPATRLSIGPAQTLVTANGVPVVDDQPIRLQTLGDTLRLEADIVSTVELFTLTLERTDGSGTVVIPPGDYTVTPAFPDSGAASSGGRRYNLVYRTTLIPDSYRYTLRTVDRYGVPSSFDAVFEFLTVLRSEGVPIQDDDPVSPRATLSLLVLSPKPLVPATELTLTINGATQLFAAAPAPGDVSGREWILTWTHDPYPVDRYEVVLSVAGGTTRQHFFFVSVGGNEVTFRDAVAFPNPFEDDLGTNFSLFLLSSANADLQILVYTVNGKRVYRWEGRDLRPGYHQIHWNGRDDEGSILGNGIYVYRVLANNGSTSATHEGRLVKLRKPRRNDPTVP